jgi:hypothetical protein
MEVLLGGNDVNRLACAAAVRIGGRMQRLMNVADKMNEKREITGGAPFIVIPGTKADRHTGLS